MTNAQHDKSKESHRFMEGDYTDSRKGESEAKPSPCWGFSPRNTVSFAMRILSMAID